MLPYEDLEEGCGELVVKNLVKMQIQGQWVSGRIFQFRGGGLMEAAVGSRLSCMFVELESNC